jgi:lipoate synthase
VTDKQIQKLLDSDRIIVDEFGNISAKRLLALSPPQRLRFSIDEIGRLSKRISVEYLIAYSPKLKRDQAQVRLKQDIAALEKNLESITKYQYWNMDQKNNVERLRHVWKLQKQHITKANLILIVDTGASHIESILEKLKKTTIK